MHTRYHTFVLGCLESCSFVLLSLLEGGILLILLFLLLLRSLRKKRSGSDQSSKDGFHTLRGFSFPPCLLAILM